MAADPPTRPGVSPVTDDDAHAGIPNPGEILAGRFRVDRVLGIGGMGVVVAAEHVQLRQPVAVKLLRADIAEEPNAVARFLREARAMGALRGENVVRVIDVGTLESGRPYMVMEFLRGRDLGEVLHERGRLTISDAADYVLQACEGIVEAHGVGIIHRDLKPPNLFLTKRPDGSALVKVLDFGVSKVVDASWDGQSLTDTATILGSPAYMSPEQIRSSKTVDVRTDVWALGVCLYKLVSGVPPFDADTAAGFCAAILLESPAPLRTHAADVPPAFEAIVMRCLQKDVTQRFNDVGELASALRAFASEDGSRVADRIARVARATSATERPEPSGEHVASRTLAERASLKRSSAPMAIGIAIVVAIVAAIAFVGMRGDRAPAESPSSAVTTSPTASASARFPPPVPVVSVSAIASASAPAPSVSAPKPAAPTKPINPPPATAAPTSEDNLYNQRR